MEDAVNLFDSLLNSVFQSFTGIIDFRFSQYEKVISSNQFTDKQMDDILETVLMEFPRSYYKYNEIVTSLTSFATIDPVNILASLCTKFKNDIHKAEDQPLSSNPYASMHFIASINAHYFHFIKFFSLIVLSDLIHTIFEHYPNDQIIDLMVSCGLELCTKVGSFIKLHFLLLDTWSTIFQNISKISLSEITLAFEQYSDDISTESIYFLINKIEVNPSFLETLVFSLNQCKQHKTLTSEMLSFLSSLLFKIQCDTDILTEFLNIIQSVKTENELIDGVNNVLCILMNRLEFPQEIVDEFYANEIYKYANDDTKIKNSAIIFLRQIKGDVSKADKDDSHFFNAMNTKYDPSYFFSTFENIYYKQSNFSICPEIFGDILTQLASIDIKKFQNDIMPLFKQSLIVTPTYLSFIMSAIQVNSSSFLKHSRCKATLEDINKINDFTRDIIFNQDNINYIKILCIDDFLNLDSAFSSFQSALHECDQSVVNFLQINNFSNFDFTDLTLPDQEAPSSIFRLSHLFETYSNEQNLDSFQNLKSFDILHVFKALKATIDMMSYIFTPEILNIPFVSEFIIRLKCHKEISVSSAANKLYEKIIQNHLIQKELAVKSLSFLLKSSNFVIAESLSLILNALRNSNFPEDLFYDIEAISLCCFSTDLPICRILALQILKHLSAINSGSIYRLLHQNSSLISEAVNRSILILNTPIRPAIVKPPLGFIEFEQVCCSNYNDLWLIFFSEIINVILESDIHLILKKCRECFHQFTDLVHTPFTNAALNILYFDSFALELRNSINIDNSENLESNKSCCSPDNDKIIQEINQKIEIIFNQKLLFSKQVLMYSFCFFNWRLTPAILPYIFSVQSDLFPDATATISFIIQNPLNFNYIISSVFMQLIDFLSLIQRYFIQIQISGARKIEWDEYHLELLKSKQDMCINYCILISAAFNNIQDQITEEELPLSYRQVLIQFLIQWADLPSGFEKLQAYATNAMLPIIHAGTIFTDGFSFDLSILQMMTQCQLSGYPVLDSLLLYHMDILLDLYAQNCFLRNRRESLLFLEAIISALEYYDDKSVLQNHVGSLVLLSLFISHNGNSEYAEQIIDKIQTLFIKTNDNQDTSTMDESTFDDSQTLDNNNDENLEQKNKIIITDDESYSASNEECENKNTRKIDLSIENISQIFYYATEQVIEAGFEIIRNCKKINVFKTVITILSYFFKNVRLIPTHSSICQRIPSKYRRFIASSFLESIYNISLVLDDEQHDSFSLLYGSLLESVDSRIVLLLYLFEGEDVLIKEKLFDQLLEKRPSLISKFLSKRCTFAYWYFMKTQLHAGISSISWIFNVLKRSFIDFFDLCSKYYSIVLHFSLLFSEQSNDLLEVLLSIMGIEAVDGSFIWIKDGISRKITVLSVISKISMKLSEKNKDFIYKWGDEALKWAIGCCDVKLGYRSLFIFNSLNLQLPQSSIQLLGNTILYHLNRASDDDCEEVGMFIGQFFIALNNLIHNDSSNVNLIKFSLKFASSFLKSSPFEKTCVKYAMPIFQCALETPELYNEARNAISFALIPFFKNIERSNKTQELLVELSNKVKSPQLYLVIAAFLLKPLPFVKVNKSFKEIMSIQITAKEANIALKLYDSLITTASRALTNNIIEISTDILKRFEQSIKRKNIMSIYSSALQRISNLKSAVDFMNVLLRVYPSISTVYNENFKNNNQINDVKTKLKDIIKVINEKVLITNCKQITQLAGMIDQVHPPSIIPYSTEYEMILYIKKTKPGTRDQRLSKRWSSSLSLTSGIMLNKSILFQQTPNSDHFSKMKQGVIPKAPIILKYLDVPTGESEPWDFIMCPKDFLELDE